MVSGDYSLYKKSAHVFIQLIFIEFLQYTRYCAKSRRQYHEKNAFGCLLGGFINEKFIYVKIITNCKIANMRITMRNMC